MAGVGILCFAASYAIALCLEVSRIFFRSSVRNIFSLLWILAGLTAHTAYLYYHAVLSLGINDAESYFLVSAWGLVLVYLYLICFQPRTPLGLVFLPIALLLIGGGVLAPEHSMENAAGSVSVFWKRIHSGTFFLATLSVCIGFVAGILYLIQDRRLRLKQLAWSGLPLPTIEWSLTVCRQAIGASIFLLGACIFSGLLLRSVGSNTGIRVSFSDPLVAGTLFMFVFLLLFSGVLSLDRAWNRFAIFLCKKQRTEKTEDLQNSSKFGLKLFKTEGRHVALLTLLAFLFLFGMLCFAVFIQGSHWKRNEQQKDKKTEPPTISLMPSLSDTEVAP